MLSKSHKVGRDRLRDTFETITIIVQKLLQKMVVAVGRWSLLCRETEHAGDVIVLKKPTLNHTVKK